jgi:hypothetical protein
MAMVLKPIIPQTKIRFVGETSVQVAPSLGQIVGLLLKHNWGPLATELAKPEILPDFAAWTRRYGDSDTEGRTAVAGAFAGHGVAAGSGAGGVIPIRLGTNAARATKTLANTAAVNAVRIDAKWTGTRGNDYDYVIDANPADASQDRFRLRYKGAVVETVAYPRADLAALVASINARDAGNITATLLVDGTGLALTAGTSLLGGLDGDALTGADYLAGLDVLEFQPFTILAAANLTDGAIQASILAWVRQQEDANRPVEFAVGGLAGETLATAIARSTALADPHVVNLGVGTYRDDLLAKDLSTAQLAPRIAGILANRGEERALTGAEIGGLHAIGLTGASSADAESAIQRGVTVLIRTDSDVADLRVAMGLTTFTSEADPARPRRIFSEPRFIRIMDLFIRRMKQWGDRTVIGNVPVNEDTRDAVRAEGSRLIDDLLRRGLILTKADGAEEDPFIRTPVTTDDTLPFEFGWQFAYTANFLLGEGRVR